LSGDPTALDSDVDLYNTAFYVNAELNLLAVTTTTFYCSSPDPANVDTGNGSITIVRNDVDPPGRSTGDTVTTTYTNCLQFGRVIDGEKTQTVVEVTGQPYAFAPWAIETQRSSNLTMTTDTQQVVEQNTARMRAFSDDGVITTRTTQGSSSSTVTDMNGNTTSDTRDFTITTTTDWNAQTSTKSLDIRSSSSDGSSRTIVTVEPLVGGFGGPPNSGIVEITATDGTTGQTRTLRVTAGPLGNATVELDADGDGVFETTFDTFWFIVVGIGVGDCFGNCEPPQIGLPFPGNGFSGPVLPPPGAVPAPVPPVPPQIPPQTPPVTAPPSGSPPAGNWQPPANGSWPRFGTNTNTNTNTETIVQ